MSDEPRNGAAGARAAGWYPDADDPENAMRWWDGNAWTTSRPRLPADAQREATAPSAATATGADAPTAPTSDQPAPTNSARAGHKPWWRNLRVWATVAVVIVAGAGLISRHFSGLDDDRSGTQQQWVDYFDRAKPAVSAFNDGGSRSELSKALKTIATSPDDALNAEAREARKECFPKVGKDCRSDINTLITDYNQTLQDASDKGLVKIDK